MPRPEKVAAVAEITQRIENAQAVFLAEYAGLSVKQQQELRRGLTAHDAEFKVLKMTLTRRAAAGLDLTELDELLVGPTGITFADGDPVTAAKALKDFAAAHEVFRIKGGLLGTEFLTPDRIRELAEIAPRDELLAMLAGAMKAPITAMASLLAALPRGAATVFQQLLEKKQAGEFVPAGAPKQAPVDTAVAEAAEPAADAVDEPTAAVPEVPEAAAEPAEVAEPALEAEEPAAEVETREPAAEVEAEEAQAAAEPADEPAEVAEPAAEVEAPEPAAEVETPEPAAEVEAEEAAAATEPAEVAAEVAEPAAEVEAEEAQAAAEPADEPAEVAEPAADAADPDGPDTSEPAPADAKDAGGEDNEAAAEAATEIPNDDEAAVAAEEE